jgi:5,10-methylenetetrahydrofolate reductase
MTSVSVELSMPTSTDLRGIVERLVRLPERVDRVVLTDNHAGTARMSPLAGVSAVLESGRRCTVCASTRDRNRLALFAHVTGAVALGADELLCIGGDSVADLPRADLRPTTLIEHASGWVDGAARIGACCAADPEANGRSSSLARRKIEAGAAFLVTQAIYDAGQGRRATEVIEALGAAPVVGLPLVTTSGALAALARYAGDPPSWVEGLVKEGKGAQVTRRLLGEIGSVRAHIYPIGPRAWDSLSEALDGSASSR